MSLDLRVRTLAAVVAKAGTPKKKKAKPKLSDKEQSERFIEAARELCADESGENFEKAFWSVSQNKNFRKK
jgi:hypothetical protein